MFHFPPDPPPPTYFYFTSLFTSRIPGIENKPLLPSYKLSKCYKRIGHTTVLISKRQNLVFFFIFQVFTMHVQCNTYVLKR